jgi:hypothetical protein
MKIGAITGLALISAIALFAPSVHAQSMGGMGGFGGHGRRQGQTKQAETPKPKVDDKAYNAALKELPDKQYDAWHGVR